MAQAYPEVRVSGGGSVFPETAVAMDTGNSSAEFQVEAWNDYGGTRADTVSMFNARLRLVAKSGASYAEDGLPPVDEMWGRVKVTGMDNGGDPTMEALVTGWLPVGNGTEIPLGTIPKDCARLLTLRFDVPLGGGSFADRVKFELVWDSTSLPLARKVSLWSGSGVLPARWNASARKLVSGGELTAVGTALVYVANRTFAADGVEVTRLAWNATLNQQDSAAAALAAGESYKATISQPIAGGDAVATKGLKAVAPLTPALPANSLLLGVVTVLYQGGGTSIIAQADIDTLTISRSEYTATAGTGLALIVHSGEAVSTNDLEEFASARTSLALTNAATNSIWLSPDGSLSSNTTGVAPVVGATKLWSVVTAGGVITTITDTRTKLSRPILVHVIKLVAREIFGALAVPAQTVDADVLEFDAELVEVVHDLFSVDAAWTAGNLTPDVRYFAPGVALPFPAGGAGAGGATIYTNDGAHAEKPAIAYNATVLRVSKKYHEVRTFLAGTRFGLDYVAVPTTGGGEAERESMVTLVFRRY